MKAAFFCLTIWLALSMAPAEAADAGTVTIVEGRARVLRDLTWYKLAPGARIREGDIIEAIDAAQVQTELATGGSLNLGGPGALYAAALPLAGDKPAGPLEFALPAGWLKLAANAAPAGIRVQSGPAMVSVVEAIVVFHAQTDAIGFFVESGGAKLVETGPAGKGAAPVEARAGEYWSQAADRPLRSEPRAPAAFVAAMPRQLLDPLPVLAPRYKSAKVQLVAEQEISFAEAEPWLAGPYRKVFLKRLTPRLRDREFRAAVDARIARYPEWDPILHPEKYQPKVPVEPK
ncbi:MAG TPA: hypothetical protein VIK97_19010 [Casimicrobiaceae bacterium]